MPLQNAKMSGFYTQQQNNKDLYSANKSLMKTFNNLVYIY